MHSVCPKGLQISEDLGWYLCKRFRESGESITVLVSYNSMVALMQN